MRASQKRPTIAYNAEKDALIIEGIPYDATLFRRVDFPQPGHTYEARFTENGTITLHNLTAQNYIAGNTGNSTLTRVLDVLRTYYESLDVDEDDSPGIRAAIGLIQDMIGKTEP